ncbi:MAG: 50S ribosomal protein L11 methyltransferase [Patescibacteria group bacterium]
MTVFVLIVLLVVVVVILFFAFSTVLAMFFTRGVPFISTSARLHGMILKTADIKPGETVYDLGCGKASLLIKAAKQGALGRGYEISLWPYVWAKFNVWISRVPVKIHLKNFFKEDLSKADVVFCYLFPEVMVKLEDKFVKEMKPGSRLVSHAFKLPNLEPAEVIRTNEDNPELGKIMVYRF